MSGYRGSHLLAVEPMNGVHELLAKVELLRNTASASRSLQRDGEVTDRKEVLRLRREIMGLMVDISTCSRDFLEGEPLQEFHNEFSKLRAMNAAHHASWPVVAIRLDDPEYAASISGVRAQYQRFFAFVDDRFRGARGV